MALERHAFGEDVARDGRREEPLFVGEPGIDRRLSRARRDSDLFDARALKSVIEKDFAGRIEDALLNLAREFPGGRPERTAVRAAEALFVTDVFSISFIFIAIGQTSVRPGGRPQPLI